LLRGDPVGNPGFPSAAAQAVIGGPGCADLDIQPPHRAAGSGASRGSNGRRPRTSPRLPGIGLYARWWMAISGRAPARWRRAP